MPRGTGLGFPASLVHRTASQIAGPFLQVAKLIAELKEEGVPIHGEVPAPSRARFPRFASVNLGF